MPSLLEGKDLKSQKKLFVQHTFKLNNISNIISHTTILYYSNNYAHGSHGPDYVDYGAYTGGYGAFGWYSDHPVGGGYHR